MGVAKILQICHGYANIEGIRTCLDGVPPTTRILCREHRFEIGFKQRIAQIFQFGVQLRRCCNRRKIAAVSRERAVFLRQQRSPPEFLEREVRQEFLRGQFVMIASIGPEELGEIRDLAVHTRVDPFRARNDSL